MTERFEMEEWYRYEDRHYAPHVNEFGEAEGPGEVRVKLLKFKVVKCTPKGVRIVRVFGDYVCGDTPRLVLHDSHKRYAYPTIEEACVSFLARKRKQLRIYRARCRDAELAIAKMSGGATNCTNRDLFS